MTLLPMENRESILCALKCFEQEKPATIPPILEDYIKQISKNGQTMLPWIYVKPLLLHKYNKVVEAFVPEAHMSDFISNPNQSHINELKQRVFKTFNRLDGKIHREDPRFPSRAGLDDNSLLMNGSLNSSPTSPSLDNLQLQRAPKSSDEEATEEEDENEDDNAKDNSSDESDERGSSISPKDNCPQTLLGNSSPTSSWPFKAQTGGSPTSTPPSIHFRSPPMSKTRLVDQPLASPSSLMTNLSSSFVSGFSKNYQNDYESDSVSDVLGLKKSSNCNSPLPNIFVPLIHSDPSKVSTTESLGSLCDPIIHNPTVLSNNCSQITQSWAGKFDPISTNSSASQNQNTSTFPGIAIVEEDTLSCNTEDNNGSSSDNSALPDAIHCPSTDILGRTNNRSSSPSSIPVGSPSDSVPSIMQVLRPIGQLEAFVQNMGSEVVCCPTVEFNTTTTVSGSPKPENQNLCLGQATVTSPLFSPTSENDIEQPSLSACSPTAALSPATAGMRRPHSPTYEMTEHQADDFTLDPVELEQSPAKRRRLTSLDSSPSASPKEGVNPLSLTPPLSSALMDSPPAILCNPLNRTHSQESGDNFPQPSLETHSPTSGLTNLESDSPIDPMITLENSPGLETCGPSHDVDSSDADQESIVESSSSLSSTGCTESDTSKEEAEAEEEEEA